MARAEAQARCPPVSVVAAGGTSGSVRCGTRGRSWPGCSGFDAGFVHAASPTFEAGGQLELSPPPRPSAAALVRDLGPLLRRAVTIAAARGVRLEAVGLNPYHSSADVPLRLRTPRYLAMQAMFDEVGPEGRRMMRLTAALQISIDLTG